MIEKAHHVKIVRVVKLTYDFTIEGCDSDKEALYCALESFEGTLGGMIKNIDGYEVLSQDIQASMNRNRRRGKKDD